MVVNYQWVDGTLRLEYEALIGNGHGGSIESSTGAKGNGVLHEDLGPGAPWKGEELTLTIKVRRIAQLGSPPALVTLTVWQSDPDGTLPGRINEQTTSEEKAFDKDGLAELDALVTFD